MTEKQIISIAVVTALFFVWGTFWSFGKTRSRYLRSYRQSNKDNNHPEIVRVLEQIPGVSVHETHHAGNGYPDISVGYKGHTHLFEIKNPKVDKTHQQLTKAEQKFHARWTGHVKIVFTVEEILKDLGVTK